MKILFGVLKKATIISLPVLIILTAIRVALLPVYVNLEYNRPSFPPDQFGFTTADRLFWSKYSIEYMIGRVSDEVFSSAELEDGTPLFNDREFKHMQDVRDLTQIVLKIWLGLLVLFLITVAFAWIKGELPDLALGLRKGVIASFLSIVLILSFVAVNFNYIFTKFHEVFFEGDTWLFYPTDNLIRLFPLVFWRDVFIFIGVVCIALGGAVYNIPTLIYSKTSN